MVVRPASPAEPDRTARETGAADDDIIIAEQPAPHHWLPNQHDLDTDDEQVRWTESAAPWADFDDMEDAILPHAATPADDHPGA